MTGLSLKHCRRNPRRGQGTLVEQLPCKPQKSLTVAGLSATACNRGIRNLSAWLSENDASAQISHFHTNHFYSIHQHHHHHHHHHPNPFPLSTAPTQTFPFLHFRIPVNRRPQPHPLLPHQLLRPLPRVGPQALQTGPPQKPRPSRRRPRPPPKLRVLRDPAFPPREALPQVLSAKPDKTLLPKLQFFLSVGVSTADLPKILIGNAVLLEGSLANCIARRCDILKSVLGSQDEVVAALKRVPWCLTGRGVVDHLVPNTRFLRRLGVTQGPISHMVCNNLGVASVEHTRFVEAAERVREMGFDPSKVVFVDAVKVVVGTSREVWEKRLEVYERWGWSGEMCLSAFRRYPQCMFMSEGKVMRTMRFLVKDMGWPSEDILRTPGVLSPNLEKTIMPRCHVVKALKSRRLIKSDSCISSFILITEKMFLDRYVTRFQERVPVLMDIYRGRIHHLSDDVGL
ncbi:Mitochodrial transcription termination factor-related [Spatholobus suberectus]|nr:Mitochodrial transcription termination factor-related [Spatholobus suberectus]